LSFNELGAHGIRFIAGMLSAIDFDHDSRLMAREIHNVSAKSDLSAEMRSVQ
jgi:hypothetical protein